MGFPVDTADGSVNIVDKLGDGTLIAEDGSKLRPTTDALVSEVIEAAQAVEDAVDEILDVAEVASGWLGDFFGGGEEVGPAEEEEANGDEDEEAPEA